MSLEFFFSFSLCVSLLLCLYRSGKTTRVGTWEGRRSGTLGGGAGRGCEVDGGDGSNELRRGLGCWESGGGRCTGKLNYMFSASADLVPNPCNENLLRDGQMRARRDPARSPPVFLSRLPLCFVPPPNPIRRRLPLDPPKRNGPQFALNFGKSGIYFEHFWREHEGLRPRMDTGTPLMAHLCSWRLVETVLSRNFRLT